MYRPGSGRDSELDSALQLARQIPANIPGWLARLGSILLAEVLTDAGDLAAAERTCAAGLARCRDAGDVQNLAELLIRMANLDLQAGRTENAAAAPRPAGAAPAARRPSTPTSAPAAPSTQPGGRTSGRAFVPS